MKPRIFISSTYYDLKYIRESLQNFILSFGYEPVLFESGDVTFEHGKPLDISCYNEVKTCQMMILIIGGRYGSKASENEEVIREYESQYVSITRKEFATAKSKKMPVLIFVEKSVYMEYKTFKENRKLFYQLEKADSQPKLKFVHVDSVNVFEFISDILSFGLPCFQYEKYEEIEKQIKSQMAGMFYLYLRDLQDKEDRQSMMNTIDELKTISERMNQMLQKVGEKVLENDQEAYKKVIEKQDLILLERQADKIASNLTISGGTLDSEKWKLIAQYFVDNYFESEEFRLALEYDAKFYNDRKLDEFYSNVSSGLSRYIEVIGGKGFYLFEPNFDLAESAYSDIALLIEEKLEYKDVFINIFAKSLENHSIPF